MQNCAKPEGGMESVDNFHVGGFLYEFGSTPEKAKRRIVAERVSR
jgi:hypothetical protein